MPPIIQRADPAKEGRSALLALVAMGALGAAGFAYVKMQPQPLPVDQTGCPATNALASHTIVIVDATDSLSKMQTENLLETVEAAKQQTPQYGKLTLLTVNSAAGSEPEERLSLCSPKPKATNVLFETASRITRRWRLSFDEPVEKAIQGLAKTPPAEASPILETITASTWRTDFGPKVPHRKMILVSDLLQHSADFSLYPGAPLKRFSSSALAHSLRPNLDGVDVEVLVIPRPNFLVQQADVAKPLFAKWLTDHGAAHVTFSDDRPQVVASNGKEGGHGL